jgi:predicted DNA-binding protein
MVWQSVRLSREDKARLKELAEKNGMNVSEIIREMIRNGDKQHAVASALQEVRAAVGKLAAQKSANGSNEDIAEIRRIVTLIARAMPAVARQV